VTPELSRRAARAIFNLRFSIELQSTFAWHVSSAHTFDDLDQWAKELIWFGELHKDAEQNSVLVPLRIYNDAGVEVDGMFQERARSQASQIDQEDERCRYWKWESSAGSTIGMFRQHRSTGIVEAYRPDGWEVNMEYLERCVTDPSFVEITYSEAYRLISFLDY